MMIESASACNYHVYGLHLVTNRPVPGLVPSSEPGIGDVHVEFMGVGPRQGQPDAGTVLYASPGIAANGEPYLQVWKHEQCERAHLGIQYTDGSVYATFVVNRDGSRVRVTWTEAIPFQDVTTYFLGPVLGCILRLRRITCLHAGVVAVGEQALAIIGPKGAGKSATVAALALRGYAVLSDDIAPLVVDDRAFLVQPGYPRLRLWPSAIEALPSLTADDLPRVLSSAEKRYLDLTLDGDAARWRFRRDPHPLAAVYVLGERSQGGALSIHTLPPPESFITLTRNTYADYMLDRVGRARDFKLLGRLAATIPLRHVEHPEGLDALPRLRDAILDDFQTLS